MTTSTRIAVLRISFDRLREEHEVGEASDGWSSFEGADGTRLEISPRGAALLVRFSGGVGALAASFGALWQSHAEPRGVAVHEQPPAGDDYEALVEGASWEGGLFAQAASMLGGGLGENSSKTESEPEQAEAEGDDAFDEVANKLMSAVAKRSSRKVLAARLAAEQGQKDLGDVLDAMEAEEPEGDDALLAEVEGRFGFNPEHQEMAELLSRKLGADEVEGTGEDQDGDKTEDSERASGEADEQA